MPLRLNRPDSLHWLHWDNEFVVFDEASGLTHQLDALTAHALMCIEDGATDLEALLHQWHVDGSDRNAARTALSFILDQLVGANLVDSSRA